MKRSIGVVSVGRSDYGLYVPIIRKIIAHPKLSLLLYVTGAHLSSRFGNTIEEIRHDGFPIAAEVPLDHAGDTPLSIVQSMSTEMQGFARVFHGKQPDILLVLGDRFEMHAAAVSAIPFRIPIAHIHGGELTYGAFDDYFRHSLTKLSHVHFASTQTYANRMIQMGEEPGRVIVSGAPALDTMQSMKRLSREELSSRYQMDLSRPFVLVTFHPVTMEYEHTERYITHVLDALATVRDCSIVFTYPNADMTSDVIIRSLEAYVSTHPSTFVVKNFGYHGYMSMMAYAEMMIGNSSSGIIEATFFSLPVVNIGTRQDGRVHPANVIDVGYAQHDIQEGIKKARSASFRATLQDLANPYGDGRASERIVATLACVDDETLRSKRFYDIPIH